MTTTWRRVHTAALLVAVAASFVPNVIALQNYPFGAAASSALQVVAVVAGVLLLRLPEHSADGRWLLRGAIAIGVSAFNASPTFDWGYWTQVGWSFYYASVPCLVVPVLRLPDQAAPARTVRRLAVGFWVVVVGLYAVSTLFWEPVTMKGYTGPQSWFTLIPFYPLGWGLPRVVPVLLAPLVVWFTAVQLRRARRAAGPTRGAVRLMAWLSLPMAWGLLARIALDTLSAPWGVLNGVIFVHNALSATSIVVVLVVAIAGYLRRADYLDALLATGGDPKAIEGVLATHVQDPTLRLRFRTDEGWTDTTGHPLPATPATGRALHPLVTEPDGPAVLADLDAAVDPTSKAVAPLLDAAGVVLARARLTVQQAAAALELRASRARILQAGVQQRHQLERDLHDGAQQHLLAAQAALARAELLHEPAAVAQAITFAQDRLTTTMNELRGLARGLHPALLSQAGLGTALDSLTRLSDRVRVRLAPALAGRRFATVTEATAWYVASEAVVNALKYTDHAVTVTADLTDTLTLTITDTGDGGADFTPDGGLAGLRDRVHAAGGTLTLHSPAGHGTTLTATLPATPPEESP